ncbi:hypothetical protein HG535_0B01780 [Zygotorulaspora mrakii]|uniref:BRO1 domain-containing protein n=1 Tax=Zygotorulaspora mrakii TaxID=42260 RepID=A0A7H9AXJ6_ZYGMR|nr:uncharacterized protein HG535_0B01780 [Zygotorulaspora mrakii]QLG71140.1 hypothetical protein HG535_0B01780 [Zygotorulaspora mrakii]
MTELLCIPFKRSLNIDLRNELSKVIDSMSYQTSSFFTSDLDEISLVREKMCDLEVSNSRLENLKQYWFYLLCLQIKFPDYQIEFTWFQTLSPKSYACSQYSLIFESLNVLYNIGSMYSILALDANDGSVSSLKKLCLFFQYSAGCFEYILDHLNDSKEPVFDKSTGLALVSIMLGQAQECFWFKALKDSHKDSILARLAQQVVVYYSQAIIYSRKSELIRSHWISHLESKKHYFEAVVDYRRGISLGEKSEYGAMVKSLSAAIERLSKSEMPSKPEFMKKVTAALKNAQRENDFIYLQPVPSSLEEVKPAPMVKSIPISDFLRTTVRPEDSLFKDLLPISLMESCTGFNERQEEYVKQHICQPLQALNKLLNKNIPKFEISQETKPASEQEMEHITHVIKDQKKKNGQVNDLLNQVQSILREEYQTDEELRKRFGTLNWVLEESSLANKPFYEKLTKLNEYLEQGKTVDNETASLFETIDRKLITAPIKLPESNNPVIKEAFSIMRAREQYIQDVEARSAEHRILPKIVSEYKKTGEANFEPLFRSHIKFFDQDIKHVAHQKIQNDIISAKLTKQTAETTTQRLEPYNLYIEDLKYSRNLLQDVKSSIESGSQFYENLLKSTKSLLIEVQEFENTRRDQKRKLEEKLIVSNQKPV